MRLMPQTRNPHSQGRAGSETSSIGCRNPRSAWWRPLPLLCPCANAACHPQIRRREEESMSISRRHFLKSSGALIVSFSAGPLSRAASLVQGPFDTHASHVDPKKLDSWIAVASDGTVTAYTGKCDLGQGMFTVQTQLVAEELCVPLDRVKLIQCDTNVCPDQGTTSGSQSTPTNFNDENLAQAAATARNALLSLAAARFGRPAAELAAANGIVTAQDGRKVAYGELG